MPRINVLPKSVAELIAAGEVVERPLSVVKELIENSIDAGADTVTVEIKNGGVKYIRVADNGCGIAREDVRTAFVSHATSKISEAADLDCIFTLGFRGEALPSIAAVSRMTVLTKTADEAEGTSYLIEGGVEQSLDEAGCPTGTTVVVRDIFFNTPARLKFLKKDVTEGNYVADVVTKTALSHPEIRFTMIRDEKTVLRTPGSGDLYETIFAIFGKEIAGGLIPCNYSYNDIDVSGFISKPLNNRANRNMQYFFVNGRSVRLPVAAPALDNAYKNSIMVGKFPMCFLNLKLDASKTDVNVHPTKTEIRFSEDGKLFETIYYAARSALAKGDVERPSVKLKEKDLLQKAAPEISQLKFVQPFAPAAPEDKTAGFPQKQARPEKAPVNESPDRQYVDDKPAPEKRGYRADAAPDRRIDVVYSAPEPKPYAETVIFRDGNFLQQGENAIDASNRRSEGYSLAWKREPQKQPDDGAAESQATVAAVVEEKDAPPEVRVIGEIFETYIIAECGSKMLMIDKHAAHERILFNQLVSEAKNAGIVSQMLLSPVAVPLSGKEYAAVIENLPVLTEAGFEAEDFGGGTVLVRACPLILTMEDVRSALTEIAGKLAEGNLTPEPEKLSWIYHSAACRAAVKAGDKLAPAQMQHFAEQLMADPEIRYCPHGRPVLYELSKYEIEKQFGRVT